MPESRAVREIFAGRSDTEKFRLGVGLKRVLLAALVVCLSPSFPISAAVPLTPAGNGHWLVPAFVNGKGPFPAVLDTGADASGIYHWFALQAHFKRGPLENLGGMTGSVMTPLYHIDRLTLDGRTIRNVKADSYPDRHDNEREALVVGNDFMDGAIAIFDFPCRTVEILPKPVNLKTLLSPRAQMFRGGPVQNGTQLTFPIRVGSATGIAVLDTGDRQTKLNLKFAQAAGIDPRSSRFSDGETIWGANSKGIKSRIGPIGTVRIGRIAISDVRAQVMDVPALRSFGLDGPAMIFGLDLMHNIRLVYDHQDRRFWFDGSKCSS